MTYRINRHLWHRSGRGDLKTLAWSAIAIVAVLLAAVANPWARAMFELSSAQKLVAHGQWTAAEKSLTQYVARWPNDPAANALIAHVSRELKRWPAIMEHAPLVPDDHPQAAFTKLCLAEAQLQLERGGDAEQSLRACLRLDPENIEARRGLVHIFRWEDRVAEARELLEELFQRTPLNERSGVLAERFLVDYGQFSHETAKQRLGRWFAISSDDDGVRVAVARIRAADGEYTDAVALAEASLEKNPRNVEARRTLVIGLIKTAQAVRAGEVLHDWPPDQFDARYWETRGTWLQDCESDFEEAAKCFDRVLAENPDDWQTRHRLSACLRVTGRQSEAGEQAKWADRVRDLLEYGVIARLLSESLPRAALADHAIRFAELYESVGRIEEARRWYELILTREPEHKPARKALDRLRTETKIPSRNRRPTN